ncbi:MAG: glycerol-3-phosphate dehydrogenase [Alphaproteobacteria bacterium]
MNEFHYDLCVIGGGINGAGIARDAAGRGLSVILVEAHDLAGATSSASSKLIHGGLRYLEQREFSMVRKALKEREVLLRTAPHLIHPIECVFVQDEDQRPQWLTRLGLWAYDRLGGTKSLPDSRVLTFSDDEYGKPLGAHLKDGAIYSDCWGNDTRLVIANAVDAASRNAKILTHTTCERLEMCDGKWRVGLRDSRNDDCLDISASMIVNAAGPWVRNFLDNAGVSDCDPDVPNVRLVKGSHLILPRLYDGDHTYVLQQRDGRIVFVAPYEQDYTLVGTTEEDYDGDPRDARISDAEMEYLCETVSSNFTRTIKKSDVIFAFSGVRPLIDDGQSNASRVTRDYLIYHHKRYDPPFLSIYGGKLTTYRALAEDVVDKLMRLSGRMPTRWTAGVPLAGGDFEGDLASYVLAQQKAYPWLAKDIVQRYACSYGTRMDYFLHGCSSLDDLGMHFGDGVYKAEIDYLMAYEWAVCTDDIIWRRSKLGLHISETTRHNIETAIGA